MYVLDKHEQDNLLRELKVVRTEDGGWTKRLVHPTTGESWTLYYPYSWEHGGGPRFLRREPVPSNPAEWALTCIKSGQEDEVIGAAHDLSKFPETWATVLDALEKHRVELPHDLLTMFVEDLGILDPENRRSIIGKTYSEITEDLEHFAELTGRAVALIRNRY